MSWQFISICRVRPQRATPLRSGETLFGHVDLIVLVLRVRMFVLRMTMPAVVVSSKNQEADQVGSKSKRSNYENKFRVPNFRWVDEPGKGLEHDRKAEGDEEYGV